MDINAHKNLESSLYNKQQQVVCYKKVWELKISNWPEANYTDGAAISKKREELMVTGIKACGGVILYVDCGEGARA